MRQRWVATIIRLSGYIYKKKSGLLTAHSLQSFFDVLMIIIAEVVLAIISVPLYILSKPISSQSAGVVQYKVRRVVTLSVLFALFLAWAIKLGFLVVTETVILPANPVTISESQVTESEKGRIIREVTIAETSQDMAIPEFTRVSQDIGNGKIYLQGNSDPASYVVLYISPAQSDNFTILLTQTNNEGAWAIEELTGLEGFKPGKYTLSALSYSDDLDQKSQVGDSVSVEIENSLLIGLYKNLDSLLNLIVIGFVVTGIFLTLLTV